MYKNYKLCAAVAAIFMVGSLIKADAFDILRPSNERETPGGEQTPVGLGFMEVETDSGPKVEFKPFESMFGGNNEKRDRKKERENRKKKKKQQKKQKHDEAKRNNESGQ